MPTGFDMDQLVEGIAIGNPGGTLLICPEEITVPIDLEGHDVAETRCELFHLPIRMDLQKAPPPLIGSVVRLTLLVVPVGIVVSRVSHRHIKGAVRTRCEGHGTVDPAMADESRIHQFGIVKAPDHGLALIRYSVVVSVVPANHFISEDCVRFAILHDHAERIVLARFRRKGVHLVLHPVSVRVAQQMKAAVVATRKEAAISGILDIVETAQLDGQFPDGEPRGEHS